jgi:hypothetical protein
MLYDAIERVGTVVEANFGTDMTALVAAKGEAGLVKTAVVYKRRPAEAFHEKVTYAQPGIGVYGDTVHTQARRDDIRDSTIVLILDYFARGRDPDLLEKQIELAAEALLQSIDAVLDSSVIGGGELEGSITALFSNLALAEEGQDYEDRVMLRFPIRDRDTGLS